MASKKSVVRICLHLLSVSLLATFLVLQFRGTNPYSVSINRWKIPVTENEARELNNLECVERFLSVIPDGSQINLISNSGFYWQQRFIEIAFPRIDVVDTESSLSVYLSPESNSTSQLQCGDVFIGLGKNE